jgi:membrane protein
VEGVERQAVRPGMGLRRALRLPVLLKRAALSALGHDCMNVGQSAAYSAMVALFPALVVAGALFAELPYTIPLRAQVGAFFYEVLPSDVPPLLAGYFAAAPGSARTVRALILAGVVSFAGASSIMATLMEGLRRAQDLPPDCWTFWQRRVRALVLVPLSLVPSVAATVLVVFGQLVTTWLAAGLDGPVRPWFLIFSAGVRWVVALAGIAGLTAMIYHLGTPLRQHWRRTLPGAAVATLLWFASTLLFGWYVTRFANYSQVYGSLGAGIALLVWLYLVFLSVLVGAEFNAQLYMPGLKQRSS